MLTTAGPGESIVPGFDTPLAGEQQARPGDPKEMGGPRDTGGPRETGGPRDTGTSDETSVREDTRNADEPRRSYGDEEDRP